MEIVVGNLTSVADFYATGDICVQPSKMESIGFLVLEPVCSGMPESSTDYPLMNEYILHTELLCRPRWRKRKAFSSQWIRQAHLISPTSAT